MKELIKCLSSNDVGSTGGHQSGVVIPLGIARGDFFPILDAAKLNPRVILDGLAEVTGKNIRMNYIYYNGKLHGNSTRNEVRLTGLAGFLKESSAHEGDRLVLTKVGDLRYILRVDPAPTSLSDEELIVSLSKDWSFRSSSK